MRHLTKLFVLFFAIISNCRADIEVNNNTGDEVSVSITLNASPAKVKKVKKIDDEIESYTRKFGSAPSADLSKLQQQRFELSHESGNSFSKKLAPKEKWNLVVDEDHLDDVNEFSVVHYKKDSSGNSDIDKADYYIFKDTSYMTPVKSRKDKHYYTHYRDSMEGWRVKGFDIEPFSGSGKAYRVWIKVASKEGKVQPRTKLENSQDKNKNVRK